MSHALFHYPQQAAFERPLPKKKIYDHAKPSSALREQFVAQVDKIVWQYKLAPETINLPAKLSAPEIQIFSIALKTPELSEDVLRGIDQAIPFPIIYQLTFEDCIKAKAAYKRPSDADANKWVIDSYFETGWLPSDTERAELPVALDLAGLYEHLLRRLLPWPPRAGETLKAQVERLGQLRSKQNECQKMEARLQKEQQFNRKVELNAQLRNLKKQLETLTS
ncbi:Methyl-accepting chemotaxis protein [Candidatus Methylobacter favarea]|uniref:Methyl-accepting chemotaxis protein n=1 Tax=Candidatus Methylobacter favarea TaxID=2707345 RepID=A0A8S0XV19_9GAMM|nr:DUF4391 domain-containing protein [Candidatus Methylobacter favarea]CAA9892568.1 Methyl-accepting chemotaxis protein [Candidatus Methylobacter favarea]